MKTIAAEIRLAEVPDAASLAHVHETSWRDAYSGLIPARSLNGMISRRHEGWWIHAIGRGAMILVVDFGGETAGYATLGRNRASVFDHQGEIYEIYLKPEFQGLGFGGRLFRAARQLLTDRSMRGTVVWALEDNDRALSFYERMGGVDLAQGSETFEGRELRKVAFFWN